MLDFWKAYRATAGARVGAVEVFLPKPRDKAVAMERMITMRSDDFRCFDFPISHAYRTCALVSLVGCREVLVDVVVARWRWRGCGWHHVLAGASCVRHLVEYTIRRDAREEEGRVMSDSGVIGPGRRLPP